MHLKPIRSSVLRLVGVAASLLLPVSVSSAAQTSRPNIIVFLTDDQSQYSYPYERIVSPLPWGYTGADVHTPNVDRLAAQGMVFTNFHVVSPVCSPSRYTTLTGRYASRTLAERFQQSFPAGTQTRVGNNVELDPPDRLNLPRLLQQNDYVTGFVGKSHIVRHDLLKGPGRWAEHGLETYSRSADPRDAATNAKMRRNHDRWRAWIAEYGFDYVNGVYAANLLELFNDSLNVHNIEWTTKAALEFIESNRNRPFFLYYAATLAHGPDPWNKRDGRLFNSIDADPGFNGAGYAPGNYDFMPTRDEIRQSAIRNGATDRTAYVTLMDAAVGALMDKLDRLGISDNTILIVSSDHGSWRYGKATLYEGGMRVPTVIRWPAEVGRGSVSDQLVANIDYVPTLLELTGARVPNDYVVDGKSFAPVLRGLQQGQHRDSLFGELGYSRGVVSSDGWKYIAVRYPPQVQDAIDAGEDFAGFLGDRIARPYLTSNLHLGHYSSLHNANYFLPDQLYDLNSDPKEERNLFHSDPARAAAMQARLVTHLQRFPGRPFGEFTGHGALTDYDNDGLPDRVEFTHRLDPFDPVDAVADLDGDGLNNLAEYRMQTQLNGSDSDTDGYTDGQEVRIGRNPLVDEGVVVRMLNAILLEDQRAPESIDPANR